ncbi:hypothetical protein [Jeotgalicoccus sp. WY2]|nr:hypothetical protein [Jeotgalicoccus sp. WY2]
MHSKEEVMTKEIPPSHVIDTLCDWQL